MEELSSSSDVSPNFLKKFFVVMGVELVIALVAIGFFVKTGATHQNKLAQAPVNVYDPRAVQTTAGKVLGAETTDSPHIIYKVVTPIPTEVPLKKSYKIAVVGDSIEDTMGETGEFLQKALNDKYADTKFLIYNYGKGANSITDGLNSFSYNFQYGIRNYPSITDLKPDIIILGSYANNVPTPYDRDWHWLIYSQLVQKALKVTPHVYILAEVAPLRDSYGDGPNGPNWDRSVAITYSGHVIELMENAIGLSKSLKVPLIDAFTPTLLPDSKFGKEGDPKDISVSDDIQPSQEGHELMAKKIAETLKLN